MTRGCRWPGSTASSASRSSPAPPSKRPWSRTASTIPRWRGLPTPPMPSRTCRWTCTARRAPVPVLWWRSVGHSHTAFVVESFLDELAHAAGKDPYQYRRDLLQKHPRHLKVLETAADKAGWGKALAKGRGRGIAVHESFGSYIAQVAEVSVDAKGEAAGSPGGLRRRLRPDRQSGHHQGPDGVGDRLRPLRRPPRRHHPEERPGGAGQFP